MKAIFHISLWLDLLGYVFKALFPVMWVLIPLGVAGLWRKTPKWTWVIFGAFIGVDLGVRFVLFFAGVPFQSRYFYPLAAVTCVIAANGLPFAADWLGKISKLPEWLKDGKRRLAFLCAVVFFINVPKGLNPDFGKKWIREVPDIIRRHAPDGEKPILLTTFGDPRAAYYAGAEHMKFMPKSIYTKDYLKLAEARLGGGNPADQLVDHNPATRLAIPKGESTLTLKLKRPYPLKRGFFFWDWTSSDPSGRCEIRGRLADESDRWTLLFKGPVAKRSQIKIARDFDELEIRFALNQPLALRGVRLARIGPWKIMRKGFGVNNEDWLPLDMEEGIERLAENVETIGGERVFLFIPMTREQFGAEFEERGLSCPFVHLRSYDIRRKGPHSLWKFAEKP